MKCIYCGDTDGTVVSSKANKMNSMRVKTRKCVKCKRYYDTVETIAYKMPKVFKLSTKEFVQLTKDDLYSYILKIDGLYEGNIRKRTVDRIYQYILTFFTRSGDMLIDDSALEDLVTDIYLNMWYKQSVVGNMEQQHRDRNIEYER